MTERKIVLDIRRAARKACAWALVAFQASCPSAKTRDRWVHDVKCNTLSGKGD